LRQRGDVRGPPELRDVARGDGAVAVPVGVGVVAGLAERLANGALGEGGVGLVDLAVAVDVLGGEVAGLAVGVVGDAEGEGAGAADGGDDAEGLYALRDPAFVEFRDDVIGFGSVCEAPRDDDHHPHGVDRDRA
jgi:hypothetical protein